MKPADTDDITRQRETLPPDTWELPAAAEALRQFREVDDEPASLAIARLVHEVASHGRA
jgi:hypothetical protein